MLGRALCILALYFTFSESRPCLSIPEIPRDQEQVFLLSKDSLILDSTGAWVDALIHTVRTVRYTGTAFIVIDSIHLRPGNPYPYPRETLVVRKDSSGVPPRELDFCNYADSIDTVLSYEDDSLLIAFLPGERGQGWIKALFSLKEGFLFYYGSGFDTANSMASRVDEEGLKKTEFARTYQDRQVGIFRAARRSGRPNRKAIPGFTFGDSRFDVSGRLLAPGKIPRPARSINRRN